MHPCMTFNLRCLSFYFILFESVPLLHLSFGTIVMTERLNPYTTGIVFFHVKSPDIFPSVSGKMLSSCSMLINIVFNLET